MRLCFVLVIMICSAGVAGAQTEATTPECAELLELRCTECHYLERVCKQVGERSKRGWKSTLKRMIKKRGAEVTDSERKLLLGCLSPPAPDIKKVCGK